MKKRYWLRGALIGLSCFILYFFISIIYLLLGHLDFNTPQWSQVILGFLEKISGLDLISTGSWFGPRPTELGNSIIIGIETVGPILVGSLFGWIYGKIKNRKDLPVSKV